MKDFKKMLKLTWKRYAIWIILVGFFFTLSNVLGVKNNLKYDAMRITDNITEMEGYLTGKKTYRRYKKIDYN